MKKILICIFACLLFGSMSYAAENEEVTFIWSYTTEEEQILIDGNGGYTIWNNDEVVNDNILPSARRSTMTYSASQVKNDFHITAFIRNSELVTPSNPEGRLNSDESDTVFHKYYVKAKITKITKREET